jgi:hypothetical protein
MQIQSGRTVPLMFFILIQNEKIWHSIKENILRALLDYSPSPVPYSKSKTKNLEIQIVTLDI